MGYSLRSWDYRYTLWLGFNPQTLKVGESHKCKALAGASSPSCSVTMMDPIFSPVQVNLSDVHAGELYMLASDPGEDNNVYNDSDAAVMMTKMAGLSDVSLFRILALVSLFRRFIHLFFSLHRRAIAVQFMNLQMTMRLQLSYLTAGMKTSRSKA